MGGGGEISKIGSIYVLGQHFSREGYLTPFLCWWWKVCLLWNETTPKTKIQSTRGILIWEKIRVMFQSLYLGQSIKTLSPGNVQHIESIVICSWKPYSGACAYLWKPGLRIIFSLKLHWIYVSFMRFYEYYLPKFIGFWVFYGLKIGSN